MKQFSIIILLSLFAFSSCKKNDKALNEPFDKSGASQIAQSCFVNGKQDVSGTMSIYSKNNTTYLVLENFKTTAGPDLKVYFSTSTENTDIVSLGDLKGTSGNFYYCIPSNVNINTHNHVLIWCENYKKLFGYSKLPL